jgi:hypothetical protein
MDIYEFEKTTDIYGRPVVKAESIAETYTEALRVALLGGLYLDENLVKQTFDIEEILKKMTTWTYEDCLEFLQFARAEEEADREQELTKSYYNDRKEKKMEMEYDIEFLSMLLSADIDEAKETGDEELISDIRNLWDGESWESILEKYNTEGSTWYVWWSDGIFALAKQIEENANFLSKLELESDLMEK